LANLKETAEGHPNLFAVVCGVKIYRCHKNGWGNGREIHFNFSTGKTQRSHGEYQFGTGELGCYPDEFGQGWVAEYEEECKVAIAQALVDGKIRCPRGVKVQASRHIPVTDPRLWVITQNGVPSRYFQEQQDIQDYLDVLKSFYENDEGEWAIEATENLGRNRKLTVSLVGDPEPFITWQVHRVKRAIVYRENTGE